MKNVLKRIGKDIWAYISCVIVVTILWSWVFSYLTVIKPEEKVCVFIGSRSATFEKYDELEESKPEYLKKLEVNAYSTNDSMFTMFLSIFGYETGDILILPESYVSEDGCAGFYSEISKAYQDEFENLGFYEANGKVYGIKVHDKESRISAIDCIDYGEGENEENYYMFFNAKSVHLSDLAGDSEESEMNGAITVARRLLEL